jgi:hypothetical protein
MITYCQWDYPTLPGQARDFDTALRGAAIQSELIFIPHESHISEMVRVPSEDDLTARGILRFMHKAKE